MDNKEIRRRNILWLKEKYENELGKRVATWPYLAEKWDTDAAYLMQIKSEKTRGALGDKTARSIEKGEGQPVGWMDIPHFGAPDVPGVAEPKVPYSVELSEAEKALLSMWRSWSPAIKRYAFGQMKIVAFTKDVLAQMFVIEKGPPVTQADVDKDVIETVADSRLLNSGRKRRKK